MEIVGQNLTFDYIFYKTDKYDRGMYYVRDERLEKLYNHCRDEDINVSLFKTDSKELIMVVSNCKDETLSGVRCVEYKGNIRFYTRNWNKM